MRQRQLTEGTASSMLRLLVVAATVIYMTIAAVRTLSYLSSAGSLRPAIFSLEAIRKNVSSVANDSELTLQAVVLDGQLVRWESAASIKNWQRVERGGSPSLPPFLSSRAVSEPASLSFHGKSFVAVFQTGNWPGVFRIRRDGVEIETRALRNPVGRPGLTIIESPAAPPSAVVFGFALVLFTLCAYGFAPVRGDRSALPWLLFFLSVVHGLYWVGQCIGTTNDSPGYLDMIALIYPDGQPDYFPPGYPAFLGLLGRLSGGSLGISVTLIQHGMVVVAALWIFLILLRIVPQGVALLGAIVAGVAAPILSIGQLVMTEAATLFAMAGALYFALRCVESDRLRFLILAGVLAGWAATLRVVPLAALIPAICAVYWLAPRPRVYRLAALSLAVTVGFLALPISWFWFKSGEPVLSHATGLHLYNRVVREQQLLDTDGPATKTLTGLLKGNDARRFDGWWSVGAAVGRDDRQFEILLGRVAWEAIIKYPWAYVTYTPYLAWKVLLADASTWLPAWSETSQQHPLLENSPLLRFTASSWGWRVALEALHKSSWPVLCWFAIAGIFLGLMSAQRALVLALAWVPIGYLLASASAEYFNPRFNAPIIPFVAALAVIPLASLLQLIESRRLVGSQALSVETEPLTAVD